MSKVQEAFVSARLAVLLMAMLSLCLIGYYRTQLFITNIIVHESAFIANEEDWFDLAVCFGPKYSTGTVNLYLKINELRQQHPDTWRGEIKNMDRANINVHGATAIDSIEKYRDFFIHKFNWSVDSMYDIELHADLESFKMGWFNHSFAPNKDASLSFHFNWFSFKYSWCYNYTYIDLLNNSSSAGIVKKKKFHQKPHHRFSIYDHQYKWYFGRNSVSEYVDVYIYPKKHEFEFPLIEDHVPFRIDMISWQRLRASARRISRLNRPDFRCIDHKKSREKHTYSHNHCLTWCLRRTLLNNVNCTTPELDNYIYNMTKAMQLFLKPSSNKRKRFRSADYFNNVTVLPWMKEYIMLKPCDSAQSFLKTFNTFEATFFPRGDKFAMNPTCLTECLPECIEYDVLIATEGAELYPASRRMHGVLLYYEGKLEEIQEKWKYTASQLFIDLSGVMSFLLGLSLITIHEWCFILTRWLVQFRSCQDKSPSELQFLRDDMRYDDYHEFADDYQSYVGEQDSRSFYPQDYDEDCDDYGGEYDDNDSDQYDYFEDTGDYGDERFDYAGDEKVIDAAHSGIIYGPRSFTVNNELLGKASHLAPEVPP